MSEVDFLGFVREVILNNMNGLEKPWIIIHDHWSTSSRCHSFEFYGVRLMWWSKKRYFTRRHTVYVSTSSDLSGPVWRAVRP